MNPIEQDNDVDVFFKELFKTQTPLKLKVRHGASEDEVEITEQERNELKRQYENGEVKFEVSISKNDSYFRVVSTQS